MEQPCPRGSSHNDPRLDTEQLDSEQVSGNDVMQLDHAINMPERIVLVESGGVLSSDTRVNSEQTLLSRFRSEPRRNSEYCVSMIRNTILELR